MGEVIEPNWALNSKVEHFVANAEYDELARYLEQIASASCDVGEVTAALIKLGEVRRDMMEDYDASIEAYQRLLEVDSDNSTALDALEMAYTAGEEWMKLLAILERKVSVSADVSARLAGLEQCAAIYEDMLGDLRRALECQHDILQMLPENTAAAAAATRLEAQLA